MAVAAALLASVPVLWAQAPGGFAAAEVVVDGVRYGYRLLAPLPPHRHTPQPLVVFLHGAGERGDDNAQHLAGLPERLTGPELRERWPCWVLCVQCPRDETWVAGSWHDAASRPIDAAPTRALRAVVAALDKVVALPGVDACRVYLTGLSMGGFGAFDLAAREPERFAALLAVCGGGDPAVAPRLLGLPTQIYHGAADAIVPVERSRAMVSALRALGAVVHYHELPGMGHDVWRVAYGEHGALDWLFAQDQRQQGRGAAALPPLIPAVDVAVLHGGEFRLAPSARCVAAPPAQAAARVLLDLLAATMPVRPGLVATGEPRPGDLWFELVPGATFVYELQVGDVMRVRAADAPGLLRGAAAAWQALHTRPERRCPQGRFVRVQPCPSGTVVLGPSPTPWTHAALLEAVQLCWLYGAEELAGEDLATLPWLDAPWRERLRSEAARHGVRLAAASGADTVVEASADATARDLPDGDDLAALLRRPLPAMGAPDRFRLRLPPAGPAATLARLRVQLPAVAERFDRGGRQLHVGGFLARLGQLLRRG